MSAEVVVTKFKSIGFIIALIVLLLAVVFVAIGKLDLITGGMLGGLALAILLS